MGIKSFLRSVAFVWGATPLLASAPLTVTDEDGQDLEQLTGWLQRHVVTIPDRGALALTELFLSCRMITEIPDSLGKLTNLRDLRLVMNCFETVPASLGNLRNLTTLNLCSNNLTEIPDSLVELTNLRKLYLSVNQFDELPLWLCELPSLETLYLKDAMKDPEQGEQSS